ncbi:MAG: EF-P lysine aminoacylase GenX [Planctomycetes bacterium]|nr:EF-P lysine aminoacylase GenX [Planctomycetota bacterium]
MHDPDSTFRPTASWQNLRLRAELLRRVRRFFDERGFLEVETPLLSADTVIDRHLDPLAVTLPDDAREPGVGRRMWLQTSPEFAMKRLLAAGAEAIFQVAKAFRAAERGRLHNPEFTMIEWYRAGDSMEAGMKLLSELAETLLERGPAERISYREAFQNRLGVDPHAAGAAELAALAKSRGIATPQGWDIADRDAWLELLLSEFVEPRLGSGRPAILYDYPAGQAALAVVREENPPVGERFELYVEGIELANGYHELLDAEELRRRNSRINRARQDDGKPPLPEESRLLAAMESGLPPCAGVAMGFDRVVMLAAGANSIEEVIPFPVENA